MIPRLLPFLLILLTAASCNNTSPDNTKNDMSNKKVVEAYMDGFRTSDHEKILALLTDDVTWEMPGAFYKKGKKEFDSEIENENFVGSPVITITLIVEEGNIVIAEGGVTGKMKNGGLLDAVFCDVFHFEGNKIKQLTTYLMNKSQPQ